MNLQPFLCKKSPLGETDPHNARNLCQLPGIEDIDMNSPGILTTVEKDKGIQAEKIIPNEIEII